MNQKLKIAMRRIHTCGTLLTQIAVASALTGWIALAAVAQSDTDSPKSAKDTVAQSGASEAPPSEPTYLGRRIAQTMHYRGAPWLVRESREREEECSALLESLGLHGGETVCDLGCGNGFYSLKLAKQVGEDGRVLAVDIQTEMLSYLRTRADEAEVKNIELIHGTIVDPRLPKGEVDLVLLVDVYHEFSHPEEMLKAIRASLKPTGRVALAEFRLEDPDVPIKLLHKMSKAQIMKEFPANGFKLVGEFNDLPWQHVMFFARDDAPMQSVEPTPWTARDAPE